MRAQGPANPFALAQRWRLTGKSRLPIVPAAFEQNAGCQSIDGAVAQLGERRVRNAKVRGSIPLGSTNPIPSCIFQFGRRVTYSVKEIFKTLQGEGGQAGRVAVFCRFAGCNLWSGREADRAAAVCRFCDTDFADMNGTLGGRYATAADLAAAIESVWGGGAERRFAVLTGGEPALQTDPALIEALHETGFEIAIETNGTLPLSSGIDWVCVSPKAGTELKIRTGNELKLVYPQKDAPPETYLALDFDRFSLQPMDGPELEANTAAAIAYCQAHPNWQLSLQTHKFLGIR